jgi:hypothetical protein
VVLVELYERGLCFGIAPGYLQRGGPVQPDETPPMVVPDRFLGGRYRCLRMTQLYFGLGDAEIGVVDPVVFRRGLDRGAESGNGIGGIVQGDQIVADLAQRSSVMCVDIEDPPAQLQCFDVSPLHSPQEALVP